MIFREIQSSTTKSHAGKVSTLFYQFVHLHTKVTKKNCEFFLLNNLRLWLVKTLMVLCHFIWDIQKQSEWRIKVEGVHKTEYLGYISFIDIFVCDYTVFLNIK